MSRITLPTHLTGKALQEYLVKNQTELIQKKKSLPIKSDVFTCSPEVILESKGDTGIKGAGFSGDTPPDTFRVKVVANTALWCDSGMDVLTEGCYEESVNAKGNRLPHIKNHAWDDCTSHVGDVVAVYTQKKYLKDLGLVDRSGRTTVLMWETNIRKDYDERVHKFYANGKIDQHSIGLQYLEIFLAVNNKDWTKEYEVWKKWIDKVINKEVPTEKGYFWLVSKIRLIENSCVLFGMNELTPTTSITELSLTEGTEEQPPNPGTGQQQEPKKVKFKF